MMEELIARARRREPKAFTELMQMHMQPMYKVARAMLCSDADVADAVQETILGCWEKIGQLKEGKYFKTWMIRMLINKCNDILRAGRRYVPEERMPEVAAFDRHFENDEWNEALKSIDEKYRLVIMLYYVEGFKTSEISQILDIPESTVRTRLSRGREKMAVIYGGAERRAL